MQSRYNAHRFTFVALAAIALAVATLSTHSDATAGSNSPTMARYEVTFVPSWNGETHPLEYPYTHGKQGLLTPIIGATHGSDYEIFAKGKKPTPGLERLSERGKHDPLDDEIREAIRQGKVGSLIEFADGSPGPVHPTVTHMFTITKEFPMVSLVGMMAPSPDWFYGVSGVVLMRDGVWLSSFSQTVYAWDSGGDSGTTYMSEDADLNPKSATQSANTMHFKNNGERVPVGTFVFKRIPDSQEMTKS